MKRLLRLSALLALLLVAHCGREPQPFEDPADCRCRVIGKQRVCNSACG